MIEANKTGITDLCGCTPQELANRTVEQNLALCKECGILNTCAYPRAVAMGMMKSDTSMHSTDTKPNLKKLAEASENFDAFHDKSHKHNPLHQAAKPSKEYYTKQAPRTKKNLKQIAKDSMTITSFHEQATEE
jgi:cell fate (sporulation/competence/biofilm development) regulator YlbF (YheA/YmcA/DUF963 family)